MSMNELSSLLKRSFEGLGYCQADYEDVAASVVWLESHGLGGFKTVQSAWPRLSARSDNAIHLADNDTPVKVVDGGASSMLCVGRVLVEFAMAEAEAGLSRIECRDVRDRLAILPALALCASGALSALAYWLDGSRLHTAIIEPGQSCPDYRIVTASADAGLRAHALYLACGRDGGQLDALSATLASATHTSVEDAHIAQAAMQQSRRESLLHGLAIDSVLLHTLSTSAERVLVESTEQSRRGAGENEA